MCKFRYKVPPISKVVIFVEETKIKFLTVYKTNIFTLIFIRVLTLFLKSVIVFLVFVDKFWGLNKPINTYFKKQDQLKFYLLNHFKYMHKLSNKV